MFGKRAMGQRQAAAVLMSTEPELLALQEQNGFADAVIAGDDVFLSGVITELQDGESDLKAAYARTFEAIGKILGRAGATWDDVIDITTFHTDLPTQLPDFVAVKKRFIGLPHPAWTAIGISRLVSDGGLTETRVRAKLAAPSS
jgi:enamine deaminase RidA (YjgF/YER057c/UK114 family)